MYSLIKLILKHILMITVGLDVHKDTIFCGIHNGKQCGEVKEFTTLTCDIRAMGEYLQSQKANKVAMESTGHYWIPVWNILEDMGFELMLVNPFLIKQMPGRKSDVKDAQWIATLYQKNLLRASLVPDKIIRELRFYSRKYNKLQKRLTSLLQETERILEMSNIRITSFVSNISAKSIRNVVNTIIDGTDDIEHLEELIHKRIRNKHKENITKSLDGFVTEHHRFALELVRDEMLLIEKQAEMCLSKMRTICKEHYEQEITLLQTIPGISEVSSMIIVAETGADMSKFENSSKFTGWVGLRPRNDESAGKYKSTAITKGNKYLKAILVQIAWAASRTKGGYFMDKFNRLAMRKSRKKALIAIARKIAVVAYNLMKNKEEFNPSLLPVYDPVKIQASIFYHQQEIERLNKLV